MTELGLAYRHQKVQRLRRLVGRRNVRQAEAAFVVEGAKVLSEAVASGAVVEAVFVAPGAPASVLELADAAAARVYPLAGGVMERVAGTVTPQPVMAIVAYVGVGLEALGHARLVVVCVNVRDPGNAGTVLRTAEASGADGVVCCGGSVDVYNPKTVRASAGALFHVPVVAGVGAVEALEQIGTWGLVRLGAVPRDGRDYAAVDLRRRCALVLGNESAGLGGEVVDHLDERITIPMSGRAESLNVGMSAAVLCFEAARQRRAAGP